MGSLTRLGIGLLRIEENIPTANRKPKLTREQKYSALFERIFMEAVGVPFHLVSLYFPQDMAAKFLERSSYLAIPRAEQLKHLPKSTVDILNKAIRSAYAAKGSKTPTGIIAKQIYERGKLTSMFAAARHEVAHVLRHDKKAQETAISGLTKILMPFNQRVWMASAGTLSLGVLISAFLSGYAMQWLNDHVVSKKIIPVLLQKLGIASDTPVRQVFMPGPIPTHEAQRTFRM